MGVVVVADQCLLQAHVCLGNHLWVALPVLSLSS
jgi:hypothetical protein